MLSGGKIRKYRKFISAAALLAAALLLAALYVVIYRIAPYSPIKPYRFHTSIRTDTLSTKLDTLDVITRDSLLLRGYFVHSIAKPSGGTIIILHGIGNNKEAQLGLAETLAASGFNCLVFDLRAHGESGGEYCTYGYYEKRDVSRYIDVIMQKYPESGPVGIMGHSLGGAIAIQSLAIDKRIKCGVVTSTFANLKEIVYDYMVRMSHIPLRFISGMALDNSGKIANFPVNEINPEEYAGRITQPVLLMHGTADENISIDYCRRIFRRLASYKKEWHEVKGATHNNLIETEGSEYYKRVIRFFRDNLRQSHI